RCYERARLPRGLDQPGVGTTGQCLCLRHRLASRREPAVRFSRFSLVGGLCAILSNGLVIALGRYGFTSTAASLLVFGPVLLMGYALHTVFTFSTRPSLLSL